MFTRMIVAVALLAGSAVALAADASFDQKQLRQESAAQTSGGAKTAAAACTCPHARS